MYQGAIIKAVGVHEKCSTAIALMKEHGFDQLPVVEHTKHGHLRGMVTVSEIMAKIAGGAARLDSPLEHVLIVNYPCVPVEAKLGELIEELGSNAYVVVVQEHIPNENEITHTNQKDVAGIVTHIDILNYLSASNLTN